MVLRLHLATPEDDPTGRQKTCFILMQETRLSQNPFNKPCRKPTDFANMSCGNENNNNNNNVIRQRHWLCCLQNVWAHEFYRADGGFCPELTVSLFSVWCSESKTRWNKRGDLHSSVQTASCWSGRFAPRRKELLFFFFLKHNCCCFVDVGVCVRVRVCGAAAPPSSCTR